MTRPLLALLLAALAAAAGTEASTEYFYDSPRRPYFVDDPVVPGWRRAARAGSGAAAFLMPKPAGRLRVFVVGGSIAAIHQDHPAALTRLLAAALPGREVEVINCGQGGYESEREQRVLEEVLAYSPDLLVLMTGHNERDDAPLLPAWRRRLAALARRAGLLRPPPPRPVDGARRAALSAAFLRRVDAMLAAARAASVPVLVVLPPLNAEHPTERSWPSDAGFLAGWRLALEGRRAAAREAWAPLLAREDGGRGASLAAVLAADGLRRDGRPEQARALALGALDARPLFGGRCSKPCREGLERLAALHGMPAADLDAAFRRAALPGYPGWDDFDDAVHWNARRHGLAMSALLASIRSVPSWRSLPWIRPPLPAPPADGGTRTLYALAALADTPPEGPPAAAVLALAASIKENPAALAGGREALLTRAKAQGGFLRAWGGEFTVAPWAWDWAEGLARLQSGDAAGAEKRLAAAAVALPGRPEPRLHLALARRLRGRLREADAALEQALVSAGPRAREVAAAGLALGSRSPRLLDAVRPAAQERRAAARARALALQAKDPKAALPLLERLVAESPDDAGLRADLGVCLALAGREEEAAGRLREALRLDPSLERAAASLKALGQKP